MILDYNQYTVETTKFQEVGGGDKGGRYMSDLMGDLAKVKQLDLAVELLPNYLKWTLCEKWVVLENIHTHTTGGILEF